MTAAEFKKMRKNHKRKRFVDGYACGYCEVRFEHEDENVPAWPCDAVKLLRTLEREVR